MDSKYTDSQKLDIIISEQKEIKDLLCDASNPNCHHTRIIKLEERFKHILILATPLTLGVLGLLIKTILF